MWYWNIGGWAILITCCYSFTQDSLKPLQKFRKNALICGMSRCKAFLVGYTFHYSHSKELKLELTRFLFKTRRSIKWTLPKAQGTRGLSSSYESNLMGHITSSNTNLDQSHLQNLDKASTSQPNNSISNKLNFQNLDQT